MFSKCKVLCFSTRNNRAPLWKKNHQRLWFWVISCINSEGAHRPPRCACVRPRHAWGVTTGAISSCADAIKCPDLMEHAIAIAIAAVPVCRRDVRETAAAASPVRATRAAPLMRYHPPLGAPAPQPVGQRPGSGLSITESLPIGEQRRGRLTPSVPAHLPESSTVRRRWRRRRVRGGGDKNTSSHLFSSWFSGGQVRWRLFHQCAWKTFVRWRVILPASGCERRAQRGRWKPARS